MEPQHSSGKSEPAHASRDLELVTDRKVVGGKDDDMRERFVEEAKPMKRQWADVEDSDEEARAPNVVVVRKECER